MLLESMNKESITSEGVMEGRTYYIPFQEGVKPPVGRKAMRSRATKLNGIWNLIGENSENVEITVPGNNPSGIYETNFTIHSKNMAYFLVLNGVDSKITVCLNGIQIGYQLFPTGMTEFDLSEAVNQGKNTLTIKIEKDEDEAIGIYDDVFIIKRPLEHVRDFKVETKVDTFRENAVISIDLLFADQRVETEFTLIAPDGTEIGNQISWDEKTSIIVPNPRLWNAEHPELYTLVLETEGETLFHRFGIYQQEVRLGKLYINHKSVHLAMVNGYSRDNSVSYTLDKEDVMLEFARMKQNNINAIRVNDEFVKPWLKEMCLEYGFYYIQKEELAEKAMFNWKVQNDIVEYKNLKCPVHAELQNGLRGFVNLKNNWDFTNLKDELYIDYEVICNGECIEHHKMFDIDLEPGKEDIYRFRYNRPTEGEYFLHLSYRQFTNRSLVSYDHILGEETLFLGDYFLD